MNNKALSALFTLVLMTISLSTQANPDPAQLVVNVAIETKNWGSGIVINGSSNLPHGTNLLISLKSVSSNFMPQSTAVVSEGFFSSGPMANQKGIESGEYIIYVISRPSQYQPASVQQILGASGTFLIGNQVVKISTGEHVVEAKFRYSHNPQ